MSSPMFNLNGFLIRPDRVCLIAPVKRARYLALIPYTDNHRA